MSWRVVYTDKSGTRHERKHNNSEGDARGWLKHYVKEHGKATLEHVADGPYDYSGKVKHIVTEGN